MTQQEPPSRNHLQSECLISYQFGRSDILPQGKCAVRSKDIGSIIGGGVEIVEPGLFGIPVQVESGGCQVVCYFLVIG